MTNKHVTSQKKSSPALELQHHHHNCSGRQYFDSTLNMTVDTLQILSLTIQKSSPSIVVYNSWLKEDQAQYLFLLVGQYRSLEMLRMPSNMKNKRENHLPW
mmetsp:Transcript_29383/g.55126  ORF Transcript_29383/g.55126 Transcript_29383/m.55126 type:complete len:101 (+) Transcript_29383:72-374(+)